LDKKVSIIIPCYNQENFVADAIDSALKQTYPNIEIVCYNDGSSDNSAKVINEYAQKFNNIIFIDNKENKGVVYGRNNAINSSSGEYILPLDADDKIEPTYVEKAVKVLNENPKIGIVYCKARLFGNKTGEWKLPEYDKKEIVYRNCIFCSALFRKTDFEKVGGYKEYMNKGLEDWDLWLSFIENDYEVFRIDEILFNYRKLDNPTRNDLSKSKIDKLFGTILENHIQLYLNNETFIDKIFRTSLKRIKKYQKLTKLFISLASVEFLIILLLLLSFFFLK